MQGKLRFVMIGGSGHTKIIPIIESKRPKHHLKTKWSQRWEEAEWRCFCRVSLATVGRLHVELVNRILGSTSSAGKLSFNQPKTTRGCSTCFRIVTSAHQLDSSLLLHQYHHFGKTVSKPFHPLPFFTGSYSTMRTPGKRFWRSLALLWQASGANRQQRL